MRHMFGQEMKERRRKERENKEREREREREKGKIILNKQDPIVSHKE